MKRLSPSDLMFLYGEGRETMLHVSVLLPFSPPKDAPADFLRQVVTELKTDRQVHAPWNYKLQHPDRLKSPRNAWIEDDNIDLEYHVRRSALPTPGDERELGVLVARLHSSPIDFHRPPWEVHLIEGLENGRFAMFIKIHHALVDGFTGTRLLARSLSTDPDATDIPLFFAVPPESRPPRTEVEASPDAFSVNFATILSNLRAQLGSVRDVGKAMLELARTHSRPGSLVSSLQAPNSILNGRVGRARRVATQQYSLDVLKDLGHRAGGTLNDMVLALCAGSLRRFLIGLDSLPHKPLVAALPVSVRASGDTGGGNSVGAILASLATDIADPRERLDAIIASTQRAKEQLGGMSQNAVLAYSAMLMAPVGVQSLQALTGRTAGLPLTFNVGISNVPGPRKPLYFRGARLEGCYPISTVGHGMGLNITCQSYAGTLNFGFVGCRDQLPHLQRLAVYTGEALSELEAAL